MNEDDLERVRVSDSCDITLRSQDTGREVQAPCTIERLIL